jgi:ATP synthase protein I
MSERQAEQPKDEPDRVAREIGEKAERKIRARGEEERGIWFGLGMFGLVGWAVAVPTVLGILIGLWLDQRFAGKPSWTLTFLFIGVVLGCINAWYWIRRESRHDR